MRVASASTLLLTLASAAVGPEAAAGPPPNVGADLVAVPYTSLTGWDSDDHLQAFAAFRTSCAPVAAQSPATLKPVPAPPGLREACGEALALADIGSREARAFFEERFSPYEVRPPSTGRGFLTGYYEPEFDGSLERSESFPTALLGRPDDLVSLAPGETAPGLPAGTSAARKTAAGLEPYPDRAAIEDGAADGHVRPVLFLRDQVDAFIAQVQGSARIRLEDGRVVRVAYAGRNGLPYTSLGRLLVEKLGIPPAEMTGPALVRWLRSNPTEARELMRRNRSYVFFRLAGELDSSDGPIGGAGVPVSAGRGLAVDRSLWSYGLPVWLEGDLPEPDGTTRPLRRLVAAQDTGTAIVGPARGDLFFGAGEDAGRRAGLVREPVRFVVLWPKPDAAPTPKP